jgi:Domain of unknown function (DUF1911)/Domain of unknown function (DUF1910)
MKPQTASSPRCVTAGVTPHTLDTAIRQYEADLVEVAYYAHPLRWWIARYSRGDSLTALAADYGRIIDMVQATQRAEDAKADQPTPIFAHENQYASLYREALVMLSMGLCVRAPPARVRPLLDSCERGDPLLEAVASAFQPSLGVPAGPPAFPRFFDGLYAAQAALPPARPGIVADYLKGWCSERMREFGFKIAQEHIGYWCFEAAGLVAALDIDDASFSAHPHYPADLVAFYRQAA